MASSEVWGWSSFFDELSRFLENIDRSYGSANVDYSEYCVNRLELCYRNVVAIMETIEATNNQVLSDVTRELSELLHCISTKHSQWSEYLAGVDIQTATTSYRCATEASGGIGRPKFEIRKNEVHLFALHYIYLPRVNAALRVFLEGWNNHSVRTAHHYSPRQLFVHGCLQLRTSGLTAMDLFDVVDDSYGVDHTNMSPAESEESSVVVPEPRFDISLSDLADLQQDIDPMANSENYAIELYESVLLFLEQRRYV